MSKTLHITFKLVNIEVLQSTLNASTININTATLFIFNIVIEHQVDREQNYIAIIPKVEIKSEDNSSVVGTHAAKMIFKVEDMENFIINNEVKLPSESIIAMNSISISTMRGLMFATFKGTHLHNAFLPIVDPKVFRSEK